MNGNPVFYDCEASCLGGLPIEIGWAYLDERSGAIRSEGHLIRPPADWDMKPVWDPDAEKLHGITLRRLRAEGRPPEDIAARMNDLLAGRQLYSDSPVDDERWLTLLFDAAGKVPLYATSRFNARDLAARRAADLGWAPAQIERAMQEAKRIAPPAHRAAADARHWAELWRILSQGPAAIGA